MTDNIRILIVANDPLARAGLATLLADQPDCTIVGQVAAEADLINDLDIYEPDVLVWDLGWEPEVMLELLAEVGEADLPLVTLLPDEIHVSEAWAAGAQGLLPREIDGDRLLVGVQAVVQGLAAIDPEWISALLPDRQFESTPPIEELTPRELEVLQLLAEGLPNKVIARRLEISEHTVKFHVNAIMGKLGAQSRTEAVVRATRLGLILL